MANHAAIHVETKLSADECVILELTECIFAQRRVSGITSVCNCESIEIAVGSDALTQRFANCPVSCAAQPALFASVRRKN